MLSKEDPTFQTPPAEIVGEVYVYDNEMEPGVSFTVEQAKRFIAINDELKLKHFQTMIDIFENPDKYQASGTPIKEYFYSQK